MPVGFGFSVGDFVAVIGLIVKICQALDEHSDVLKDFNHVRLELKDFEVVTSQLQASLLGGSAISEQNASKVKQVLDGSVAALDEFQAFVLSYKELKSAYRRVLWTLHGKKKLEPFRHRIRHNVSILGLVQQELIRDALKSLEDRVQNRTDSLSDQLQRGTKEVKLHISASLDDPWDQKPIKFQDAVGRRYPVPMEMCQRFDQFIGFLELAFKDSPLLPMISKREIWLFTPSGNDLNLWYLINEEDWKHVARPGMRLGMSAKPHKIQNQTLHLRCVMCNSMDLKLSTEPGESQIIEEEDDEYENAIVHFEKPLPAWATYPEDLKFKFFQRRRKRDPKETTAAQSFPPHLCARCDTPNARKRFGAYSEQSFEIIEQPSGEDSIHCKECGLEVSSLDRFYEHKHPSIPKSNAFKKFDQLREKQTAPEEIYEECLVCMQTFVQLVPHEDDAANASFEALRSVTRRNHKRDMVSECELYQILNTPGVCSDCSFMFLNHQPL